jgi:hypothetical protein
MHLGVSVGAGGRQMSEVPSERHSTDVSVAKDEAWREARSAQQAWAEAMRMHQLAPPDAGFRARLRSLADAARAMHDAHARALESGLAWRPIKDSEQARPPYELRAGTGRRGPAELWARFDAAVGQLNEAGGGDSLADVVAGYAAVSATADALADALEVAGE